jgi:hypothetical protein
MVKHLRVPLVVSILSVAALGTLVFRLNLNNSDHSSSGVMAAETDAPQESLSLSTSTRNKTSAPTDRMPEVYYGSFFYHTSAEMLAALKVDIYPEDKVYAFPDPTLGMGSTIKVYRAQPVLIKDGNQETLVRTWATTVANFVDEQRLELGDKDIIQPARDQAILPNQKTLTVSITRVSESSLTIQEAVPFGTQYTNDANMIVGTTRVDKPGVLGQRQKVYLVRRENGVEVSRTLQTSKIIVPPVDQVVAKGTKPKVVYLTSGQYKEYFNEAADKYGVSPDKLHTLMLCESGGNVNSLGAGGLYKGLFQFDDTTWSKTPYASRSIFDAEAQVLAAAYLWNYRAAKWPLCVSRYGL